MVRKIFKKRKDNSNKTKPRGRKRKLAASAMLSLRLLFGGPQLASSNSNTFQSGGNSETEISRVSEQNSPSMSDLNQAQPEQVRKGTQGSQIALKIPSGGDSSRPSKFGSGSKAKGAAKRDFSQRQAGKTPTSRQSSGSFFTDAFTVRPQYPGRPGGREPFGRENEVEWKKENKCSADSLLDSTKCYGHREASDIPREVTERFEASAVSKLAKNSLKDPLLKKEYARVKKSMKEGIHPINIGYNSAFVSSDKVLIKCSKGRYLVEVGDTKVDIIGVVARGSDKSVKSFEKLRNKMYNLDLQY